MSEGENQSVEIRVSSMFLKAHRKCVEFQLIDVDVSINRRKLGVGSHDISDLEGLLNRASIVYNYIYSLA